MSTIALPFEFVNKRTSDSLKCSNVRLSAYYLSFENSLPPIVINLCSRIQAWRSRLEPVAGQRFHSAQIYIRACDAGLFEHGVGCHGAGIRLMWRNVEVKIIMKSGIYTFGVLPPFSSAFKIKDIVFNSILYKANQVMLEIADIIGARNDEIKTWVQATKENYFSYFSPNGTDETLLYDYDLIAEKRIVKRTAASLISLCTDLLSQDQAKMIASWMKHSHICKESCVHEHPVFTSISVDDMQFNPLNYWRGPVWININWMIYKGLKSYGILDDAENLKKSVIDLIDEHGFYEYYNPLSGEGLGADNFSWTAALLIDLLSEEN